MAKRRSPDSVVCIDLTEDDDDREENLQDVRKRLKGTPAASASAAAPKVKVEREDDDDGGGKIGSCAALQRQAWQQQASTEVQVLENVEPAFHPVARATSASDDVVLVGTANESRLPHMRQHCPDHNFTPDARHGAVQKNSECCDLCFCYVCDKPAKECEQWLNTVPGTIINSHCNASDAGNDVYKWRNLRQRAKNPNRPQVARTASFAPRTPVDPLRATPVEPGPFEPDNAEAAQNSRLTKCRKCGWYNRFAHHNFENPRVLHPTGFLDWCQSCGRVASEKDFGKVQGKPYKQTAGDVFLGERVIPFRIVAHDPRKMDQYKERWTANEGTDPNWTFSQAEMEHDVFRHRFGDYPSLEMILASIPVVSPDDIPDTGSFYSSTYRHECVTSNYYNGIREGSKVTVDETEAVVLENRNDVAMLEELRNFRSVGSKKVASGPLRGDIVASWDAASRCGTFTVRIFIHSRALQVPGWKLGSSDQSLSRFLGTWFNIFPFSLTDLSGPIRADKVRETPSYYGTTILAAPPFEMNKREFDETYERLSGTMKEKVKEYNGVVEANQAMLSMDSGSASNLLGGVCSSETGLAGILKRYCRESFIDDLYRDTRDMHDANRPWMNYEAGRRSNHRSMRKSGFRLVSDSTSRCTNFDSYVKPEDHVLAKSSLREDSRSIRNATTSLKGMMDHLENLHHPPVPFVEGLTVELLEFQRQSVQWALERETTPGGIQSFLWAKLPSVAEPNHEIYFNPILERFREGKPRLVRGGIIAEEMGLGKTVISLALILQNPAPLVPLSGSAVTVLNAAAETPGAGGQSPWDKELHAWTSESNNKRGSILSRGTLVVCPVSLVGQWIDEARSKLKDPGLVYPYHGQNRKRDAATLSKNAIVVTTYQVLASDATYHAKKGGTDYCAPCEQVRWWRIICDESHSIRDTGTQRSLAVMNLVADHKWLVSGTPVNTSLQDLKNQLKFIGLEDVEDMMHHFAKSTFLHVNDRSAKKGRRRRWLSYDSDGRVLGPFTFLMRAVMMRHTQKQKYRGTTTTLMSLPPKVERKLEVLFTDDEKEEYQVLENAAKEYYISFKARKGHELSKHFLRLTQKLTPLRIAASGGQVPLDDEADDDEEKQEDNDDDDEEEEAEESADGGPAKKKRKKKKEQRFSDFAYKSKVDALLVELKRTRDEDPHAKSLVFSQFTSTLNFLQQELPRNGFQFRTLSGDMSMKKRAKALHDFQHDPPTTIFLLSMRAGAVGINLTQANRVFLMEPSFNPALEAQAIGRVHRLGQKRKVEVVRMIVKDSVESRILEMLDKKYGTAAADLDDDEEGEDAKPKAAKPEAAVMVGSIHTDRTKVLGEEFDILFGVDPTVKDEEMEDEEAEVAADPVLSSSAGDDVFFSI